MHDTIEEITETVASLVSSISDSSSDLMWGAAHPTDKHA